MATSPANPVIYSIKSLVFNSFTTDFFAPKNGKCCKNQPVICSVHIFLSFHFFSIYFQTNTVFFPGNNLLNSPDSNIFRSVNFISSLCIFLFFFFFQVQLVSLRNFAAFWLSLLGIEKHQTHYRFLRWTNFLVLMPKILFFPELKLFLIHPIIILQVNLS